MSFDIINLNDVIEKEKGLETTRDKTNSVAKALYRFLVIIRWEYFKEEEESKVAEHFAAGSPLVYSSGKRAAFSVELMGVTLISLSKAAAKT